MHRRNFLKTGSLAGLTISTLVAASCGQPPAEKKADAATGTKDDLFELSEATVTDLQQKMQDKKHTSRSLTELYLKRINGIDKNGPKLNSVIELNKDALNMADAMDRERAKARYAGRCMAYPC